MRNTLLIAAFIMLAGCRYVPTENNCNYVLPRGMHLLYDINHEKYIIQIGDRYLGDYKIFKISDWYSLEYANTFKDSCCAKGYAQEYMKPDHRSMNLKVIH